MGQPNKLNTLTVRKARKLIKAEGGVAHAAKKIGVTRQALHSWLKRNKCQIVPTVAASTDSPQLPN